MKTLFNFAFILFILGTIALTNFLIGPFSLRIPFGLLTGVLLVLSGYKVKVDSNIRIYLLFSVFFFFALVFNGELLKFSFLNFFLGKVLLGIVMYYAVGHYIVDFKSVNKVMFLFLGIAILNDISSILQYFKNPLGDLISLALSRGGSGDVVGFSESQIMTYYENALKIGVPGIFVDRVSNGYFSGFALLVPIYLMFNDKRRGIAFILYSLLFLLNLVVLFITQQRSALVISLFLIVLLFWRKINFRSFWTFIVGSILSFYAFVFYSNQPISKIQLGRYGDFSDSGRDKIYDACIKFIENNIFFGGPIAISKEINAIAPGITSPHNFLLTSFGYAGIFGGITICILYFRMLMISFKSIQRNSNSSIVGCMLLTYLLNSLLHNGGLMEGEGMIWLLFALLIKVIYLENSIVSIKNNNTVL